MYCRWSPNSSTQEYKVGIHTVLVGIPMEYLQSNFKRDTTRTTSTMLQILVNCETLYMCNIV